MHMTRHWRATFIRGNYSRIAIKEAAIIRAGAGITPQAGSQLRSFW